MNNMRETAVQTIPVQDVPPIKQKSQSTYAILALFLGKFGAHNFYAGRIAVAIGQLVLWVMGSLCVSAGVKSIELLGALMAIGGLVWRCIDVGCVKNDGKGRPMKVEKVVQWIVLVLMIFISGVFFLTGFRLAKMGL